MWYLLNLRSLVERKYLQGFFLCLTFFFQRWDGGDGVAGAAARTVQIVGDEKRKWKRLVNPVYFYNYVFTMLLAALCRLHHLLSRYYNF